MTRNVSVRRLRVDLMSQEKDNFSLVEVSLYKK